MKSCRGVIGRFGPQNFVVRTVLLYEAFNIDVKD